LIGTTHPVNSDRVKRLRRLIERLPERREHLLSSSEFNHARARAISLGAPRQANDSRKATHGPILMRRQNTNVVGAEEHVPDRLNL
jgi:predicted Zn-dependent protease